MIELAIRAEGLHKTYQEGALHVDVLRGVDLSVKQGEQVAIVGASGSGKTTLLHILGGLDRPSRGNVFIQDQDISAFNERQISRLRNEKLGYIYQFHHLLPEFSVLENVAMPLLLRKLPIHQVKRKVRKLLEKVGLKAREQHKLAELSGGERQRTAIARALVTDPICVLADEPTGNLDGNTAERVYQTMLELNSEFKTSFVVATHDRDLASKMDSIYHLVNGKLHVGAS